MLLCDRRELEIPAIRFFQVAKCMSDFEFQKYIRHGRVSVCVHGRHLQANRIQSNREKKEKKRKKPKTPCPLYKTHALRICSIH